MSFPSYLFQDAVKSACCSVVDADNPAQNSVIPLPPAPANTASRKRTHSDDEAEADQSASKRPRLHDEATADEPQCLLTRFEWTQHSTLKQTTTTTMSACSPPTAQSELDSECPICQETVFWCAPTSDDTATVAADGDLVQWALVRHECGNTFHSTCLDPWCAARRDGATTCPMCRGVILDPPAPAPAQNEAGNLHGPQSGLDANLQLELFDGSTLSSLATNSHSWRTLGGQVEEAF
ncbi:hypothetical protein LTR70_009202 [Exophiala xenobiotica]|uniref:RING-type domain-containing protein n=1 Tax=Lithohypha guttulata TaxID=1690604 RepID=A0ABR0JX54_9EURO|nr:hypothetical protein LTR24_009468 [Lithohypha guttulata]KAK5310812.1 hypothetical protein LTR70_009202 [Exophiala xenobiotica]